MFTGEHCTRVWERLRKNSAHGKSHPHTKKLEEIENGIIPQGLLLEGQLLNGAERLGHKEKSFVVMITCDTS